MSEPLRRYSAPAGQRQIWRQIWRWLQPATRPRTQKTRHIGGCRKHFSGLVAPAYLTSMRREVFCASSVLGSVTVRTPSANEAAIWSRSTLSGTRKLRWQVPRARSLR